MAAHISEVAYAGVVNFDFIEVAVSTGTDVSAYSIYVYDGDGSISEGPLSLGSVVTTVAGKDVYLVNSDTTGFQSFQQGNAIALVDDTGAVLQFLSFNGDTVTATEGPADGLTSTDIGTAGNGKSLETGNQGGSYFVQSSMNEGTVPCVAPGTMIDTPDGPRAVESLRPGDRVTTEESGPAPVRRVRQGGQALERPGRDARPVLIQAGALGPGRPSKDLIVSPQHRILVGGAGQLEHAFQAECLVPAKALTGLPRIRMMQGKRRITWVHFALDRQQLVRAEGGGRKPCLWAEWS